MRAVNLIPADARRGGDTRSLRGPGAAVVGVLAAVLVLVTLYVMAANHVSQRQAELASVKQQVAQTQALVAKLGGYTQFAQLAQARVETVQEIASSRFDWQRALSDLSRVVPANTSLSSLTATVSPSSGSGGGSTSGGLRGDITSPAFELQGCTASQDDVARLMSRLRLIRGVTRVTLADSVKTNTSAPAAAVSGSAGATSGACAADAPKFDLVVFFEPLPAPSAPTTPAAGTPGTPPATGSTGGTQ